jgi:hypothetical protein
VVPGLYHDKKNLILIYPYPKTNPVKKKYLDCSWNIRVRVWRSLHLYKASSVAGAMVGCSSMRGRRWYAEQGLWGFCACGDAFEFSICGGISVFLQVFGFFVVSCSFLWVEFGCELSSPEMFYFTNDMFSVFWFWTSRGLFFWFWYVLDWNAALGWAESMNVAYVPAPLVCLLQLSSDGYCRDAISGC